MTYPKQLDPLETSSTSSPESEIAEHDPGSESDPPRHIPLPRVRLRGSTPALSFHGDDPPLERLRELGPRALCDAELLALVLQLRRSDSEEHEAIRDVLRDIGLLGLTQLDEAFLYTSPWEEGPSAALLAAVELTRRLARLHIPERKPLAETHQVANYLTLRYQTGQEILGALFLDLRRHLIAEREIFRGTISRATVSTREIVKLALLYGASSLVLFHTHPSGDPAPSTEDLLFTQSVRNAVELMGMRLEDHLILGLGGRFVSLRARRLRQTHD